MPDQLDLTLTNLLPELFQVTALLAFDVQPKPFAVRDLHFEWNVKKTLGPAPDEAVVRIYNEDPLNRESLNLQFSDFASALALAAGAAVIAPIAALGVVPPPDPTTLGSVNLFVGWKGKPQLLFSGVMTKLISEVHAGVDTITEITLSEGGPNLRDAPVQGTVDFGMPIQLGVVAYAQALGLQVYGPTLAVIAEKASKLPVQNIHIVNHIDPRIMLDQLFATLGLSWAPVNKAVVVYDGGIRNDLLPVRLDPGSGLLDYSRLDDGGYRVTALALPALEPGGRVTVFDEVGRALGAGQQWCQIVEFSGDNDGQSTMVFTMRKLDLIGEAPDIGFL